MDLHIVPESVWNILQVLENGGHQAYLVGGCVRDLLMGRVPNDWDITTSAKTEEITALFEKTVLTGARFGTVTVFMGDTKAEVTTFRRECGYGDGRRPDAVEFISDLREDLQRRDFTINAMALAADGSLHDPFGGQADLRCGLIRCVGDPAGRFGEDGLRMFRALRFAAQLGFTIDPETLSGIRKCSENAAQLSAERIRDEVEKILLSPAPEKLAAVIEYGLLARFCPVPAPAEELLQKITALPCDRMLRWSAFCAMLLQMGELDSARFFTDLRLEKRLGTPAAVGAESGWVRLNSTVKNLKRTLSGNSVDAVRCAAAVSDVLHGGAALEALETVLQSGEPYSVEQLAINGDDLIEAGYTKGRETGMLLHHLLNHVIHIPKDNNRETLLALAGELRYGD